MAHTADLHFPLEPSSASAIVAALRPETDDGPEGTTTRLELREHTLHVHVTGEDLSGLRAAIHSVVRLLDAAQRTLA